MSRRAERLIMTFFTDQRPASSRASAPTLNTPEGWPKRTRPSGPTGAKRLTTVPGIANCIEGRFRQFWEQNGGLPVFGYPISPAMQETTTAGTFLTQTFERSRLEYHL